MDREQRMKVKRKKTKIITDNNSRSRKLYIFQNINEKIILNH